MNAASIGVTVPSVAGGLVLDVLYGQNSTTSYTAAAGQTKQWDTNTKKGVDNLEMSRFLAQPGRPRWP